MKGMNKKGLTLYGFFAGLAILAVMASTFAMFHQNLVENYGGPQNVTLLGKYNYTKSMVSNTENVSTTVLSDDNEVAGFFTIGSIAAARQAMVGGVQVLGVVTTDVAEEVPGIPDFMKVLFVGLVLLALAFLIMSAIFRYPLIGG